MAKLMTLHDLLIHELKDLYSAEEQIIKALPKMAQAATSPKLKEAFETHLKQTQKHIERLDEIAKLVGTELSGHKCLGIAGIIAEGEEIIKMKDGSDPNVLDAALISAAQRVEHYEMAGYGCAEEYADELDLEDVEDLLEDTLDEEGETNKLLTKIAEGGLLSGEGVNEKATQDGE